MCLTWNEALHSQGNTENGDEALVCKRIKDTAQH